MKITMYELLGLVKDGKAPKKVKYKDKIYYYHEGYDFNYMYNSSDYMPMDEDKSLFTFTSYKPKDGVMCWDNNTAIDFLNDKVEILEEPKVQVELTEKEYLEYLDKINKNIKSVRDYIPKPSFLKLEEEKKIPEKIEQFDDVSFYAINEYTWAEIVKKINSIIDYLKSKGDE